MLRAEKTSFVSDSTVTNKFGDRPPSTYSIRIQSLSQLKNMYSGHGFKSHTFTSGKFKWILIIYPKGNKKDNGSGFLSLYVELITGSKSPASTVLAYLTFFVYNKKENKYFTIHDVERKEFNALRPVWGLPQVLPLDTFNDPKNGYVFEGDQCEFGVDVMVPLTNWEIVSFSPKSSNGKFSWTVNKFSKLKEHCYVSNTFSMGKMNWVLKMYPKGYSKTFCDSLSIYLHFADNEEMKASEHIYTLGKLQLIDPFGSSHLTGKINHWHDMSFKGCGWNKFVPLAKLREAYLDKEGSLNIEIEFEVICSNKYSL